MKRLLSLTLLFAFAIATAHAQLSFENRRPVFKLNDKSLLTTPAEGLWSVATGWQQDWMCGWVHASADEQKQSGEWTILTGKISFTVDSRMGLLSFNAGFSLRGNAG